MKVCRSIVCPECGKLYNCTVHRPYTGKCKHTICLTCKENMNSNNCPICDEVDAFKDMIYDYTTAEFLADFSDNLDKDDFEKCTMVLENLGKGPCTKCGLESPKLRVCVNCTLFLTKCSTGGFRPTYWLQGLEAFKKTRSFAICANCVLEHHKEHKVVTMTNIRDINGEFEIVALTKLRELMEEQWKGYIEGDESLRPLFVAKSTALQCIVEDRIDDIRAGSYENSAELIADPAFVPWKAKLQASLDEVRKYRKIFLDLRKTNRANHSTNIRVSAARDQDDYNRYKEIIDDAKMIPQDFLPIEEYRVYYREAVRRLVTLSVEMAGKWPERRTDADFLRCEVLKEQITKVKASIRDAMKGVQASFLSMVKQLLTNMDAPTDDAAALVDHFEVLKRRMEFFRQVMLKQVEIDAANVKQLKALIEESYIGIMIYKCGCRPSFRENFMDEIKKWVEMDDEELTVET